MKLLFEDLEDEHGHEMGVYPTIVDDPKAFLFFTVKRKGAKYVCQVHYGLGVLSEDEYDSKKLASIVRQLTHVVRFLQEETERE